MSSDDTTMPDDDECHPAGNGKTAARTSGEQNKVSWHISVSR